MPIYDYACVDCGGRDQRVAGLDDHAAVCQHCGGLMLRLDEDIFAPYFAEQAADLRAWDSFAAGLAAARQQLEPPQPFSVEVMK